MAVCFCQCFVCFVPLLNSVGQVRRQSVFVSVLQSCFCQCFCCFSDVCVHVCIKAYVYKTNVSPCQMSVLFFKCVYIHMCIYAYICMYVLKCMYKRTFLLVKWLVSQFILSSVTCTKNECFSF